LIYTVTDNHQALYRVKGSKFLSSIHPATTNSETEKILQNVKNENPTATHYCYGSILLSPIKIELSSDDGEPGGTAGLPILNVLKSFELVNTIAIVVRYYGGSKLGKSGLIEAYSTAAKLAVEAATLKQVIPIQKWLIQYDYPHQSIVDKLKNDFTIYEIDSLYLENVTLEIGIPNESADRVIQRLKSHKYLFLKFEKLGELFHIVE
jgi:uncharacterized YigZ family protein